MTETILIAVISVFAAAFGSNGLWELIKTKKMKKTPLEEMVLALGRAKLLDISNDTIQKGYIEEDEYEVLIKLGEAYFAMGGNSLVKKKFDEAKQLPIK